MSFLIPCPNCGERGAQEFRHGGEISSLSKRRSPDASPEELSAYFYFAENAAGEVVEWWHHSYGCGKWLVARRDTVSNRVIGASWPQKRPEREPLG